MGTGNHLLCFAYVIRYRLPRGSYLRKKYVVERHRSTMMKNTFFCSQKDILTTIKEKAVASNIDYIIEFDGTNWTVSFDSENEQYTQYVTNLTSNIQYRYIFNEGWMKAVEGWYGQGNWSITI